MNSRWQMAQAGLDLVPIAEQIALEVEFLQEAQSATTITDTGRCMQAVQVVVAELEVLELAERLRHVDNLTPPGERDGEQVSFSAPWCNTSREQVTIGNHG